MIECTVRKVALLRLANYLAAGLNRDQNRIKREIRYLLEANAESAFKVCNVVLGDDGGFSFVGAESLDEEERAKLFAYPVNLNLEAEQLSFLLALVNSVPWPRMAEQMELEIDDLAGELLTWIEEAQAEETYKKLPKKLREQLREEEQKKRGGRRGG